MKTHSHKRTAFLAFALLLIGVSVACLVWVRNAQQQYALNRQLIAALKRSDANQARILVEVGADPNTRLEPTPAPSLPELVNQLFPRSPRFTKSSPTALLLACGAVVQIENGALIDINFSDTQLSTLIPAMLVHGANPHARDDIGMTPLHWLAWHHPDKEVIRQVLALGADPNCADYIGTTPLKLAEQNHDPDLLALLRKYSKHH